MSELAALRYNYDPRGRIRLEPKDQAKARLGRSPDLADAVMLALWAAGGARGRLGLFRYDEVMGVLAGELEPLFGGAI